MNYDENFLVIPSVSGIVKILKQNNPSFQFEKGVMKYLKINILNGNVEITHRGKDLKSYSKVWLTSYWNSRDLAFALSTYLDYHEIPHTFAEQSTSKITDQVKFALNGIETPNTVYADREMILENPKYVESKCRYPLIIKDAKGSRGKYSVLVRNREDLLETLRKLPKHKTFLYQSFINNDYDWGILVANGRVVSAERSYSAPGEYKNNSCNGASEEFVEISEVPHKVLDMAIKASGILELSWSRSDIIVDKNTGEPYLLEVNRCPGITAGSSEATGVQTFMQEYFVN